MAELEVNNRVLVLKAQVGGGGRARRHGNGVCRQWKTVKAEEELLA